MIYLIALFFVLSPGVLLTLPPGGRGLLMSGQTSLLAAAVHAVVFALAYQYLFGLYEGFKGNLAKGRSCSNNAANKMAPRCSTCRSGRGVNTTAPTSVCA